MSDLVVCCWDIYSLCVYCMCVAKCKHIESVYKSRMYDVCGAQSVKSPFGQMCYGVCDCVNMVYGFGFESGKLMVVFSVLTLNGINWCMVYCRMRWTCYGGVNCQEYNGVYWMLCGTYTSQVSFKLLVNEVCEIYIM